MYTIRVPFKDLNDKPHTKDVHFNLFEVEVFKLLPELLAVFKWIESMQSGEERELDPYSVRDFYTQFEELLLAAYGVPSEDGLSFSKTGRYDFAETVLFNATMLEFVGDPQKTVEMIQALVPKGLVDLIKKADENLEAANNSGQVPEALQAEVERLRAELASRTTSTQA